MNDFWCFLYNSVTKWCYILYYFLPFLACSQILLTFLYRTSINECVCWKRISVKGQKSIFQRRKPSKWWPKIVMAEDVSHTFSRASAILVRQMEIFYVSLLHPRGQLWAKNSRKSRPFDWWKWPSKYKMAKFDHKNGHNPKVTFGQKFALRILSQEYSSDLI